MKQDTENALRQQIAELEAKLAKFEEREKNTLVLTSKGWEVYAIEKSTFMAGPCFRYTVGPVNFSYIESNKKLTGILPGTPFELHLVFKE